MMVFLDGDCVDRMYRVKRDKNWIESDDTKQRSLYKCFKQEFYISSDSISIGFFLLNTNTSPTDKIKITSN